VWLLKKLALLKEAKYLHQDNRKDDFRASQELVRSYPLQAEVAELPCE
jgi:hypothetical protein